jgi:hypothetical protein
MPLSNQAQAVIALKSRAPPAGPELVEMIKAIKKNLSNGEPVGRSSGGSQGSGYVSNGFNKSGGNYGSNGSFRAFGSTNKSSNNYHNNAGGGGSNNNSGFKTWNGFRREVPTQQYDNLYSAQEKETIKSIPVKVEPDVAVSKMEEDVDGWTTVKNKKNYVPSSTHKAAPSTPAPHTATYRTVNRLQSNKPKEEVILNSVILGKLNKFSETNFNDVKEFLQQILDGDEKDFLRAFMKLVFEKAAMESTFCPLYAKLLGSLVEGYPVLLEEMNNLHGKYLEIFSGIAPKSDDYEAFVAENKKKAYRLGYSQFLGELIKLDILSRDVLINLYSSILNKVEELDKSEGNGELIEEYTDCLVKLTRAFSERGMTPLRVELYDTYGGRVSQLASKRPDAKSVPAKARFAFMDCLDILKKK